MAAKTLIIVPTYNERENLERLVKTVDTTFPGADFLIVDDNSPDGTGALAEDLAKRRGGVSVLHRERKEGLGAAYIHAFKHALATHPASYLIQMDADLSHDPKYLPAIYEALQSNDLVLGSRYVKGGGTANWGLMRRFISQGGSLYTRIVLGMKIRDFTGGFNAWRRETLAAIDLDDVRSKGFAFQIEMKFRASRLGFRLTEVPIVFPDRTAGKSKMSKGILFEALFRVWQIRFSVHQRQRLPSKTG